MHTIRSVGVLSVAKTLGITSALLALLFVPFLIIFHATSMFGPDRARLGLIEIILLAIVAPLVYGATGFLWGALAAWAYNLAAKRIGGITIELESQRIASFMVPPAS
jgi:hypothetical protein